jgi:ribose transport system ATP-binding protein
MHENEAPPGTENLVEMVGICKRFPGVDALRLVDFSLRRGEIHALLGHNGAGKSTLIKVLCGVYRSDAGQTRVRGHEVDIDSPQRAEQLGIAFVPQEHVLVENLDAAQNIFLKRLPCVGRRGVFINRRELYAGARKVLKTLGVDVDTGTNVAEFSAAQQKVVEIARALAFHSDILILDEPTAALTETEQGKLFEVLRVLRGQGIGIVYITHRLEEIFELADRATVLREGRVEGTVEVKQTDLRSIIRMMIGREVVSTRPQEEYASREVVLEVSGVCTGKLRDVSFKLYRGEVLGLTGLVGSGRTSLARILFGLDRPLRGTIRLRGRELRLASPAAAIAAGIGLMPEDRKRQGLILNMTVLNNLVIVVIRSLSWLGFHRRRRQADFSRQWVRRLEIATPSLNQQVNYLSGGNQQKVVLAKWLASEPRVLILDEPTVGLDVAARTAVHKVVRELAAQGLSIIVSSSEVDEILSTCDRTLIMHNGRVVTQIAKADMSKDTITGAVLGGDLAQQPA